MKNYNEDGSLNLEKTKKNFEEIVGEKLPKCMSMCEDKDGNVAIFFKEGANPDDAREFAIAYINSEIKRNELDNGEIRNSCSGNYISGG